MAALPREHHMASMRQIVVLGPDTYTKINRPILPSLSLKYGAEEMERQRALRSAMRG